MPETIKAAITVKMFASLPIRTITSSGRKPKNAFEEKKLKRRGRVHPQDPGFTTPRVFPAVRHGAFKIQAVPGFQQIALARIQRNLKFAAQYMKKFLTF